MSVSLTKGIDVSLTDLTAVVVGLGWDLRTTTGSYIHLDTCAIVVASGQVASDRHFVFFGNLATPDGSVVHTGDNGTRESEVADERIKINLAALTPDIDRIVFPVSVYDAENRHQSFGQVRNAFIRIVNQAVNTELTRYDFSKDTSTATAMIFGEIYRNGEEWRFRAPGQEYATGLSGITEDFGVSTIGPIGCTCE